MIPLVEVFSALGMFQSVASLTGNLQAAALLIVLVVALLLAPMVLPPFVGALGFQQFWGRCGVINTLLEGVGIQGPGWFWDPNWALPSVILHQICWLGNV